MTIIPVIAGDLWLEPIDPAHAVKLYPHLLDSRLYTYIPHEPPVSIDALMRKYQRWCTGPAAGNVERWLNYAVYNHAKDEYVGTLQATLQTPESNYIAYETFPHHWGQGIAKTACGALLKYIFGNFDVSTMSALIDTRNIASIKLIESLGFVRTGFIENADHFKGAQSDEFIYKLDKSKINQ